ncbi:DUF3427 domain-containing protein [Anaerosporobacter faecicola]|uniref:DUF3427 domain-containing protein n=1 Tax=Anaerosporobacter faecicola TaxID=2718714 RepID=UPI001439C6AA|nr:DEAD/DEAH box helicase [Anaerosporobacter faecicola]
MQMENILSELSLGMNTAYMNSTVNSNLAYRPEFVSNNYKKGKKVLSSLEWELENCDAFSISVAFITKSGITPMLQTLKALEKKQIPGQILTTDYLMFSDPEALETLHSLKNIEVRMFCTNSNNRAEGFHTKGYIFEKDEIYRIIIGSSNMTLSAITTNREWNTKIVSTRDGEIAKEIVGEFQTLWTDERTLPFDAFISDYADRYKQYQKIVRQQRQIAKTQNIIDIKKSTLKPNAMQVDFINNLNKLREDPKVDRAMLISATGTGKTYASAFALREMKTKRALFIVHREQIARQAMASYQRVFDSDKKFVLLSGNSKDYEAAKDADFVFATMQMMAKDEIHCLFSEEHFTEIILDECHHAGAESYQRILSYFKPIFWLGMTASPETKRFDVYAIFDHNIAYEIRLQQALEEDLLCPFHYFGITDIEIDGEVFDDETGTKNFNRLVSDERVNYVIEQAKYYGHSGDRVKGLIFCSRKEEAKELSLKFNQRGYCTEVLTGEDNDGKREEVIEKLVMDVPDHKSVHDAGALDYIFSVDIFSEGVDIPQVNQVIMLRPTQSPIVFVQQLGRGLRKALDKEYVVILDFIGNYKNNFMIPIALSGDRSYNKDSIRRYVMEGERVIPGASTIHFDEISKKRIFAAIDSANFSDVKLIKENYYNLKCKLGRIPKLTDFDQYGEMDVCCIFDNSNLGSYYKFLVKYEKEYSVRLSEQEEKTVEFISKKLASGKRIHELELLKRLLSYYTGIIAVWRKSLSENYSVKMNELVEENVINVMTNEFPSGSGKKSYSNCIFLEKSGGDYTISKQFKSMLQNPEFRQIVEELIEFGIARYRSGYSNTYADTDLVLYQKYTYEDVCRLLNWEHNEVPLNIGGYKYDRRTNTFPIFINYDKEEDISATTNYEDHFVNNSTLIAISKSGRSLSSDDVQNFLHAEERGICVELFVRKNKDDKISKEFYYLGRVKASGKAEEFVMQGTEKTAVEIEWILNTPVRDDIYDYFVS